MKKAMLIAMLLIVFTGSASATHFTDFVINADCSGWSASGNVYTWYDSVEVKYDVKLFEGATMIEQYAETKIVCLSDQSFSYGETWSSELCGEYSVNAVFELYPVPNYVTDTREYNTSFVCECASACTGTPGYWKNHPDEWPVDQLTIGGNIFYKSNLLEIFGYTPNKDKSLKLFHHLVAAKLNVIRGAHYEGIGDAIADADDFFAMYPTGSDLDKSVMRMIDELKAPLEAFNESAPCGEEVIELYESTNPMFGANPDEDMEETSWSAVKSMYKK